MKSNLAEVYAELRQDFRASKNSRFTPQLTGVSSMGSGADYHYRIEYQYLHMMERARHFERNDPVVGQGIRRLVSNVVQDGFHPDPYTGDVELDAAYKDLWSEWANDPAACHSEAELTFHQIERLTLRSVIRDGDLFHLLLNNGSIQPVEGHRPRTPSRTTRNVVNGIMLDKNARRTEVWISKEELSPMYSIRLSDLERYAMRDAYGNRQVLQVYFPDRFSQRRGITALAPCSDIVGMQDDLQFSTLVKAQLASLLVILREQDVNTPAGQNAGPPIGGGSETNLSKVDPGGVSKISGIQAGIDYLAPPGQTIKGFAPDIPSPGFFEHANMLLGFISINLDLPLQVLLLDPMKSNFSSWRGAIDQARVRFREMQTDIIQQLHMPVWIWKTNQWASQSAALRRMIKNNPYWQRCHWNRPRFAYIEPNKDAQADMVQATGFLSSMRAIHAARGGDWDEAAPEIVADRGILLREAMKLAAMLNDEFPGSGITWRDVLSPSLGAVTASSLSQTAGEKPEPVSNKDSNE